MISSPDASSSPAIKRYKQQAINPELDAATLLRLCLPTCLFTVAKALGYMRGVTVQAYTAQLDYDVAKSELGWSRPQLSSFLRERYNVPVVSWWTGGHKVGLTEQENVRRMMAAGYLSSEREQAFYSSIVKGSDIFELVRAGYPVVVTVIPGFGHNRDTHSIIIARETKNGFGVVDPDDRNSKHIYTEAYLREFLKQDGACSIILPSED